MSEQRHAMQGLGTIDWESLLMEQHREGLNVRSLTHFMGACGLFLSWPQCVRVCVCVFVCVSVVILPFLKPSLNTSDTAVESQRSWSPNAPWYHFTWPDSTLMSKPRRLRISRRSSWFFFSLCILHAGILWPLELSTCCGVTNKSWCTSLVSDSLLKTSSSM